MTSELNIESQINRIEPTQEALESVAWVRKKTVNADVLTKDEVYGHLLNNSIAVVGENMNGDKVLGIEFPHIQSDNLQTRLRVRNVTESFYERYLTAAVETGLLTPEEADKSRDKYGFELNLSRLKASTGRSKEEDYGTRGLGRIPVTSAHQVEVEARNRNSKKVLAVGGLLLLTIGIAACMDSSDIKTQPQPTEALPEPGIGRTPGETPEDRPTAETVPTATFDDFGQEKGSTTSIEEVKTYIDGKISQGENFWALPATEQEVIDIGGDPIPLRNAIDAEIVESGQSNIQKVLFRSADGPGWVYALTSANDSLNTPFWSEVDGVFQPHQNVFPIDEESGEVQTDRWELKKAPPQLEENQKYSEIPVFVEGLPFYPVLNRDTGEIERILDQSTMTLSPYEAPQAQPTEVEPTPTEEVETPQTVAERFRYSEEECADCVIRDQLPRYPGVRKELWSDTSGLKAYWTEESGWVSTKGWAGMLKSTVYAGEGFDRDVIQKSAGSPEYFLTGVLDGTYIEEPFQIRDPSDNVLMTNRFAFPLYYLDNENRLNSVIALHLAEINGEFKVLNGDDCKGGLLHEQDITEPSEIIDFYQSYIEGKKGKVVLLSLRENFQISGGSVWEWDEAIRLTWNAYQEAYSGEYQTFLESGTGLEIIFKRSEGGKFYFKEEMINLP